ncbi:hypothetical protein DFH27DRAFT_614391 [Peziza echinospora]|nr:hypothetical protein DFH27DRAFT_614391 [Peziza echinospora]
MSYYYNYNYTSQSCAVQHQAAAHFPQVASSYGVEFPYNAHQYVLHTPYVPEPPAFTAAVGGIYFFPINYATSELIKAQPFLDGKPNHPVLVINRRLDKDTGMFMADVMNLTTFGGRSLEERYPNCNRWQARYRNAYIPLHTSPTSTPHPDNNLSLPVAIHGKPNYINPTKQSYVHLEVFSLPESFLISLGEDGEANVTPAGMETVVEKWRETEPWIYGQLFPFGWGWEERKRGLSAGSSSGQQEGKKEKRGAAVEIKAPGEKVEEVKKDEKKKEEKKVQQPDEKVRTREYLQSVIASSSAAAAKEQQNQSLELQQKVLQKPRLTYAQVAVKAC